MKTLQGRKYTDQLLDAIKAELKQQRIKYGYTDVHSLIEHIWRSYTEDNPINAVGI